MLKFTGTKPGNSKQKMPSCTRCGKPGHHPSKCGKVGHIKTCMSGTIKGYSQTLRVKGKNVKTVQELVELHSMEEYNYFSMKSAHQRKPYTVTLKVNGASYFVIS